MKVRISATIDRDTDKFLDDLIEKGNYRNKSHVVETAIKSFWAREKERKNQK